MLLKRVAKRLLPLRAANFLRETLFRTHLDESRLVFNFLRSRVRQGVMADVGAHWGGASLPFAGDGWRIFAFEPDKKNLQRLRENLGRLTKVTIDPRAVTDKSGEILPFFNSEISTGISSLYSFDRSHEPTFSVETISMRDYFSENVTDKIDFLKIDAEGGDFFVLKSFPFELLRPSVILAEYEERKTAPLGVRNDDFLTLFREHGYEIVVSEWYPIETYGRNHKWKTFADDFSSVDPQSWGNIIAFADSGMKRDFLKSVKSTPLS